MQEVISAVIIDNQIEDIFGISEALSTSGISSTPIHYKDVVSAYEACRAVAVTSPRVIITDIQMRDGGAKPTKSDFANVARCIEGIISSTQGPYIVLAWTTNSDAFTDLEKYVLKYLDKIDIRQPFYFGKISKDECKPDGIDYSTEKVMKEFQAHLEQNKDVQALMHWERTVLHAAHQTVNALYDFEDDRLANTLSRLGNAVAGKNLVGNQSQAIYEALSYILKDKLAQTSIQPEAKKVWEDTIDLTSKRVNSAAKHKLNSFLHIDFNTDYPIVCPGDVWEILEPLKFFERLTTKSDVNLQLTQFNNQIMFIDEEWLIKQRAKIAASQGDPNKHQQLERLQSDLDLQYTTPQRIYKDHSKVVMLEISPACDFSNQKRPLKSFILGRLVPTESLSTRHKISPEKGKVLLMLRLNDIDYTLILTAKYVLSFSERTVTHKHRGQYFQRIFRVRESLLQSWIDTVTSYNSRIGTVSFH